MPNLNAGALAPVSDEVEVTDLNVIGQIPAELNGLLIRNGPNPLTGEFSGSGVMAWWPEAAMLHGIRLANGQALSYRNRWIKTRAWAAVHAGETSASHTTYPDTNPNVNVIHHAGQTMALAEGGQPLAINSSLETLGTTTHHPLFAGGFTAHPKIDPKTQELMGFRADWNPPWLRYCVLDRTGATSIDVPIDTPGPAMMHDMAITATHSILFDLNVGYDLSMLQHGHRMPLRWQDARQARLGIVPRHGVEVRWLSIEPCFIQHVVNAYDAPGNRIVLDVVRYPHYFKLDRSGVDFLPNPLALLWRYTIDLHAGSVTERALDDRNIELPRINEAYMGQPYRYAYAVLQPTASDMRGIVQYDLKQGTSQHYQADGGDSKFKALRDGDQNSEPVFVPRRASQSGSGQDINARRPDDAEADGWLLVCVYRQDTHASELHILVAGDLNGGPVAVVDLERRIPAGFHGAWVPI